MNYSPLIFLKSYFPLVVILLFLGLAACENEPGCVSNNSELVKLAFYKIDDTTQRNPDQIVVDRVEAVGGGGYRIDSVPRERTDYILDLNPSENVSTYYIFRKDGEVDTIVLYYQREQQLLSPDCGPTQRFFNLRVDTTGLTTVDSFRVVEPELSRVGGANLEIYTCQDFFYTDSVKLNFQKRDTLVRADTLFVQTIRDETGRVLVENDTVTETLALPVNPLADRAVFTFELLAHGEQPARTETLTLTYEQESVRFAESCRLQTRYFNLDTLSTGTTFDSVRFADRELVQDLSLNLQIVDLLP